ncbi:MAG: hypothetical protein KTR18_02905 [Acidiferrobacterales bacterium]|nr:hypothetical protein [Acidiferrobacterales bacterium]
MVEKPNTQFLKIVVDEDQRQARHDLANWLLADAPDPCPDNAGLILSLTGCPDGLSEKGVRELIEDLVSDGSFDRIQIGSQQHLTRRVRPVVSADQDKERFQLEIAIDLENEKQLLYRIVIVLELVVIGLILRQWILDPGFSLSFS